MDVYDILSGRPHTATAKQRADTVVLFEIEVRIPSFLKFQVTEVPIQIESIPNIRPMQLALHRNDASSQL